MVLYKKCSSCAGAYEYEGFANLIAFCPHCHSCDLFLCDYGFGPVVPCRIYLGNEVIATVSYYGKNERRYQYDSDKYDIHKILEHTYLEALVEAQNLTAKLL